MFPLADSLDTIGPMARSAADAAAMFGAFAGPDPMDPTGLAAPVPDFLAALDGVTGARGFRIGLDQAYLETGVDGQTIAAIQGVIAMFRDLGAVIVPVTVPDRREAIAAALMITDAESASFHKTVFEADKSLFGPQLAAAIERGLSYHPTKLSRAYITQDRFKGELSRMFSSIDALISPVYPMVGALYDEMDTHLADLQSFLGFTSPFNLSGSPSITMPCGMADVGMPLGVQLIGPHLTEASLLRAAHAYQQATDWHLKRPPIN